MKPYPEWRRQAIAELIEQNILHQPNIISAMMKVPREEFLPQDKRDYAYVDMPIPIGFSQTTSALHMTALFCEWGEMKMGQHILEVGGGCGYMSCVYAEIVAPSDRPTQHWGHVWSAEIVPELANFGRTNVERLGYSDRVTFIQSDASEGLVGIGPFDLIITTSAAPEIPEKLIDQLRIGGILLIPVGRTYYQELIRVRKHSHGIAEENLGGVAFVPMRGKRGWTM